MRKRRAIGGKYYFIALERRDEPVISRNKILYHGTVSNFKQARSDCNRLPGNHGLGFYLTPSFDRALLRAKEKAIRKDSVAQVYVYIFDDVRAQRDADAGKIWFENIVPSRKWLDITELFWDRSFESAMYHVRTDGILIMPSSDAMIEEVLGTYRQSKRTDHDVEQTLRDLELDKYGEQYYFGTDELIGKYLTFVGKYIRDKDGRFHFQKRV